MMKGKKIIYKRLAVGIGLLLGVTAAGLLTWHFLSPLIKLAADPESFRAWVAENRLLSRLIYILAVILQVLIAVIPGEPLELAGGYAFGALEGTLLCLAAATLGSILVFLLVRKFGIRLAEVFFSKEKLHSLSFLKSSKRREILFFILFSIPGTPKDLLCYFAGLTDMRFSSWLLICTVGRLPSLVTSTVGGSALGDGSHLFAIAVFAVTLLVSGAGLLIYRKICERHKRKEPTDNPTSDN